MKTKVMWMTVVEYGNGMGWFDIGVGYTDGIREDGVVHIEKGVRGGRRW